MKAVNVDDILKILHKYGKYIFVTDEKSYCSMVDEIANLKDLKQEPKTGHWIPVSERLPKAGEYADDVPKYYLVQNEYGDMMVARYTHSEYWEQIYQLKPIKDEIVAWMPLPEPYKAESEKKNE